MKTRIEGADAIRIVDELLASVGLEHGTRKTLAGTWQQGARLSPRDRNTTAVVANKRPTDGTMQIAAWHKYRWLRHGFSTRSGGVTAIYDESASGGLLNLGWTKEDQAEKVAENRRRFLHEIAHVDHARLLTIRQFHSSMLRIVEREDGRLEEQLQTPDGRAVLRGDGMMTDVPDLMLGVQVADCVPVLIADVKRRAVAAFHAGWRGTLGRIVENGLGRMRLRYGSCPEDLVAAIGPSIGPCCYSVGEEVRYDFESQFAYAPSLFSEVYDSDPVKDKYPLLFLTARAPGHSNIGPQIHLDLWESNRRQLLDAGLKEKQITVVGECSACCRVGGQRKYFSHRAESGLTGRMMGIVGVAGR